MDSKQLRKLRLSLDLKQHEMAKKLGISLPTYSLYERGKAPMSKPVKLVAETLLNSGLRD